MKLVAPPEMRDELFKDLARRRAIVGFPPIEEFLSAYVSERFGNPAPMQKYLAECRQAQTRRKK
jgi:hypothetical protein